MDGSIGWGTEEDRDECHGLAFSKAAAAEAENSRSFCPMPHPQIKQWLLQKSVTSMQMLSTIKLGQPTGEPVLDENGDWRITVKRVAAGRNTQITLAVKADHFVIVNVN